MNKEMTVAVYSADRLDSVDRGLVSEGVEFLGQYVGGVSDIGFKRIKLSGGG